MVRRLQQKHAPNNSIPSCRISVKPAQNSSPTRLIWLVGSWAKLEPNDKISTCVKRKPCLLCMCQLSPLQTSPCNCLPTPLGKAETKTEYQPSVSMVPSDGHWAKPKNPRMLISCSHVLTCKVRLMATGQSRRNGRCQYSAYMFWRGNFVLWRLGKAGKTKDVCLLLIYMFWRIDFGGWAKPKKTRMAVYMFDASTSSGGHWAKPKKTTDVSLVLTCCDA